VKQGEIMTTFGERLKTERQRLQLTQERMAEVGGVRKNTQCLYEAGRNSPDTEYLQRLGSIGLDIHFLFYGERNRKTLSVSEQAILAMYQSCSPTMQAMLLAGFGILHQINQAQAAGIDESRIIEAVRMMQNFFSMDEAQKRELEAKIKQASNSEPRPPAT
jgi:transcriptional regulator with XRE-family HTH domain